MYEKWRSLWQKQVPDILEFLMFVDILVTICKLFGNV